jgi:hypothetical protein
MEIAQQAQKENANQHHQKVNFDVGKSVMITTKNWELERPSRKLSDQWAGSYKILEKIRNTYRLDLPKVLKIHPVFAPEKLRKATRSEPLPGQIKDPPPPIEVDKEEEWEVEEVMACKMNLNQRLLYRVKWRGYDTDNTWYPARNLKNSPRLLQEFHKQNLDCCKPPWRLPIWLEAAEKDEYIEDHTLDNWPKPSQEYLKKHPRLRAGATSKRGGNVTT